MDTADYKQRKGRKLRMEGVNNKTNIRTPHSIHGVVGVWGNRTDTVVFSMGKPHGLGASA